MNDFQCSDLFIWVIIVGSICAIIWFAIWLLSEDEPKKEKLTEPPIRKIQEDQIMEFEHRIRSRMADFESYVIDAEYKYKRQLELEQGLRAELTFYVYQDKKTKNFQLSLKPINRANLELYSKFQQNVWKGQIWEE